MIDADCRVGDVRHAGPDGGLHEFDAGDTLQVDPKNADLNESNCH